MPLAGLLFKPHYLLRHRDPHLLLETLLTLVITLALSGSLCAIFVAVYVRYRLLMWSAVRLHARMGVAIFIYRYGYKAHAGQ